MELEGEDAAVEEEGNFSQMEDSLKWMEDDPNRGVEDGGRSD